MKGIGVDTVAMSKFKNVLTQSGQEFLDHVFTSDEREYCFAAANPHQSFAGHFAAKEALVKAIPSLRSYGLDWNDLEVTHDNFGAPTFVQNPKIKNQLLRINATSILLSISHSHESAVAMVAVI